MLCTIFQSLIAQRVAWTYYRKPNKNVQSVEEEERCLLPVLKPSSFIEMEPEKSREPKCKPTSKEGALFEIN
jgi:hypothetical protein